MRAVDTEPSNEVKMRFAVIFSGNGGWHVDDSFDKFGFVHSGHGPVAAFEFVASQVVAAAQRWDPSRRVAVGCFFDTERGHE
jgi:hypothetical protein